MKSGIVLINKPAGVTSFDCIRSLKRAWKRTDLGHGGTLDRFATGLLPVLAGEGLKLVRFFLESYPGLSTYWKSYRGVLLLGTQTVTGDPEGEVLRSEDVSSSITDEIIADTMKNFEKGPYLQTPPAYSAKKLNGERASDLAREGKLSSDALKSVEVTVREFKLTAAERTTDNKIRVSFDVTCSKGTYVRKLAEDLGEKLGTAGTVLELCRTDVGNFNLSQSTPLDELCSKSSDDCIQDMSVASSFLPRIVALDADVQAMRRGQHSGLSARLANAGVEPNVYCAATPETDVPVALLELNNDQRVTFLRAFQA